MAAPGKRVAGVGPAWRRLRLALVAFAMIAGALFGGAIVADRAATLEGGRTTAINSAALLAEQVDRALRVAQVTTERLASMADHNGIMSLRDEYWGNLVALDDTAPEIDSLWVVDAQGRLVTSSSAREPPQADFSDRDYFRAVASGTPGYLHGLTLGRSGKWYFGWAQAIRRQGRFVGMVQAALSAEGFARMAQRLEPGPGAELALLHTNGTLLMQWPMPGQRNTLSLPQGRSGVIEGNGPDGMARLIAWQAMPTMPAIALVALSRDHVLAPFRHRLLRNGLLFALSVAIAGGLGATALLAGRREAQAMQAAEERGAALAEALAERLHLLASLQVGEARLRAAQRSGGIGLWDLDLEARRISLAGDVFAAWGVPGAQAAGFRSLPVRAALRGIHADDRSAVVAAVMETLHRGAPLMVNFRLADQDPPRWIGARAESRPADDGPSRRLLGIVRDVTAERLAQRGLEEARASLERRVAERTGALAEANARLREGEARFRGLFNSTFQFIGLLSPDGTVLEANAAMLRLGGALPEEVIGHPYWSAPWWPRDDTTQMLLREAIAQGATDRFVRCETAMRDAEGRAVVVDFSVTPVRDEDGIVSLLVAEARDVSALKEAQALLHEAQKMDTLGQLTGGVAHDFNNLLMAVLGNLAVVRKRAAEAAPDLLRALDNATQAAERGASLTRRLLAFARRQDLKPVPVDLPALLQGVEALLRRSAGPLVTLRFNMPEGLPAAQVDPHALELALVNLAVNARDAMPEGGELAISVALQDGEAPGRLAAGRWLTVSVSDTGTGMDMATLSRAVEPFFTTKGPGQGTGLGLSMVHGVAAQSGGALVLESEPGKGTTATLWLPVSSQQPVAMVAEEPAATAEQGSGIILVVDDEPLVLESTAAMLEDLGYEAVPVDSAEAALAVLATRDDVEAVLTDYAMPGMTGAALAARLRMERPGLPVILATGYAATWSVEAAALPRLSKPYSLSDLSHTLREAMGQTAG